MPSRLDPQSSPARPRRVALSALAVATVALAGCSLDVPSPDDETVGTDEAAVGLEGCTPSLDTAPAQVTCTDTSVSPSRRFTHALRTRASDYYDFAAKRPRVAGTTITVKGKTFMVYGGFSGDDPGAPALLERALRRLPQSHVDAAFAGGLTYVVADRIGLNGNTVKGGLVGPPAMISWYALARDKANGVGYSLTALHEAGHVYNRQKGFIAAAKRTCAAGRVDQTCITTKERETLQRFIGPSHPEIASLEADLNGNGERLADVYMLFWQGRFNRPIDRSFIQWGVATIEDRDTLKALAKRFYPEPATP